MLDGKETVEQLIINISVQTEAGDGNLRAVAKRFETDWVSLIGQISERDLDDEGQPILGVIAQSEGKFDIRILVSPNHMTTIANLLARTSFEAFWLSVCPYKKLWEWDGENPMYLSKWRIEAGTTIEAPEGNRNPRA